MNETLPIPTARPLSTAISPVPSDQLPVGPGFIGDPNHAIVGVKTDRMAIASAVCGLTAIIPVISQVIGLGLGIGSLVRIGRAKRDGVRMPGAGWAWTGILSSGFALVGWVAMLGMLVVVGSSLTHATGSLDALIPGLP